MSAQWAPVPRADAAAEILANPPQYLAQNVCLVENFSYLGIYFSLQSVDSSWRASVHVTVAKWIPPARRYLTAWQRDIVLTRATEVVQTPLYEFASAGVQIARGGRPIVTFNVHGTVHLRLRGLHQTAYQYLGTRPERLRESFHLSVDACWDVLD